MGQPQSFLGHLIKDGCLDRLLAVATKVCETQVISHDQDDVGANRSVGPLIFRSRE
jgi:hypothetical protein